MINLTRRGLIRNLTAAGVVGALPVEAFAAWPEPIVWHVGDLHGVEVVWPNRCVVVGPATVSNCTFVAGDQSMFFAKFAESMTAEEIIATDAPLIMLGKHNTVTRSSFMHYSHHVNRRPEGYLVISASSSPSTWAFKPMHPHR